MKTFILIFEDKGANELKRQEIQEPNIKEARRYRDSIFAASMYSDLKRITVRLK